MVPAHFPLSNPARFAAPHPAAPTDCALRVALASATMLVPARLGLRSSATRTRRLSPRGRRDSELSTPCTPLLTARRTDAQSSSPATRQPEALTAVRPASAPIPFRSLKHRRHDTVHPNRAGRAHGAGAGVFGRTEFQKYPNAKGITPDALKCSSGAKRTE